MKEIIILRGLPFSGKTTWAEKFKERKKDVASINLGEIAGANADLPKAARWAVVRNNLEDVVNRYETILINDVNILPSNIQSLLDFFSYYALIHRELFTVEIKDFHTPYLLCVKRAQDAGIDERALRRMRFLHNYCLRRKIIYNDEENS